MLKIGEILFASYGTPIGTLLGFEESICHAESSSSVVENLCLNQQTCELEASNQYAIAIEIFHTIFQA